MAPNGHVSSEFVYVCTCSDGCAPLILKHLNRVDIWPCYVYPMFLLDGRYDELPIIYSQANLPFYTSGFT